jgi:hypothetical protein
VLPLGSYEIIIGNDWLEKNKVVLNCYEKSFVYKNGNKISRTIQGIRKPVFVRQISSMQFKKWISKGCKIYVIQVTNFLERENKPILEEFAVLHGFKDVFIEEILELPPRREIDLSIDILSRSALMSNTPYRMSVPELT